MQQSNRYKHEEPFMGGVPVLPRVESSEPVVAAVESSQPVVAQPVGQIQQWMQSAIMHPNGVEEGIGPVEVESVLTRSRALTALERLAIYGAAYRSRLVECLEAEFPVLKHVLGEDVFDGFAVEYLQHYPSRSYTLFQLGGHFPRFLDETRPDREERTGVDWPDFLIDLATLERTFNEIFDGPGTEGETPWEAEQFLDVPPERLLEARLVAAPCLRLLRLSYPAHRYFTAVRRRENPGPPEPEETWLAVTRRDYIVRHYELSRPAYHILDDLLAGGSLGQAIGRAVESAGADRDRLANNLWTWFRDWAAEGFFRAVELPSAISRRNP
jgi:hypothetical protein